MENNVTANFIALSNQDNDQKIDWGKVAASGIKAVVVKVSENTSFMDYQAKDHVTSAKKAGLLVHAYHFYQGNVEREAPFAIASAKAAGIPAGAFLFIHYEEMKEEIDQTTQVLDFCKRVAAAGYKPGVYLAENVYTTTLNAESIKATGLYVWLGNNSNRPQVGHDGWQFSDTFVLAGYDERPVAASIDFSGLLVGGADSNPDPVTPYKPPKRPKIEPGAYVSVKKTSAYSPNGEDFIPVIAPDGVHLQDYDLWEIGQKIVYEKIRLVSPNGAVFLLSVSDSGQLITRKEVK